VHHQTDEKPNAFEALQRNGALGSSFCVAYADLIPGKRYEISSTAISGNVSSTRVLRNRVIEPGFDFTAFGLAMKEHADGTLHIEWPQSEAARQRLVEQWKKIVGVDSKLHLSIMSWPQSPGGQPVRLESSPTAASPSDTTLVVDSVIQGACYRVLMYTVTGSSGIVSEKRFEQTIRMSPPQVEMALGQIRRHSATIQSFLLNKAKRRRTSGHNAISSDCSLNVLVQDLNQKAVFEKQLQLQDNAAPSLDIGGLKPFQRYTVNSQVFF
jgi:hypothetical protein